MSPQAELYYRLSDALGAHDVDPEARTAIQEAYVAAGGDNATWDSLPAHIQRLIEQIEASPRTAWDDPADVPDDYEPNDDAA
jgi:hypothetical protein